MQQLSICGWVISLYTARFVTTESVVILITSLRFLPKIFFPRVRFSIPYFRRGLPSDAHSYASASSLYFSTFAANKWKMRIGREGRTPNPHAQKLTWCLLVHRGAGDLVWAVLFVSMEHKERSQLMYCNKNIRSRSYVFFAVHNTKWLLV